ncbi:MAG: hypothetical protein LBK08_06045 [Treponema sp.]|jgi:hypothetical protein|nr:hypothetical protein [Treponema sp.]
MLRSAVITSTLVFLLSCETLGTNLNDAVSSIKASFNTAHSSGAQNSTNKTYPQIIHDIDSTLSKYSPESSRILDDVAKSERNSSKDQILLWYHPRGADEREDFYNTLDTAVHETVHKFTSLHFFNSASNNIQEQYLVEGKIIRVQHGESLIKTEVITGSLPPHLRTFRWETYVSPNAAPSANQHGIYGLLNEFNAYYRGLKSVYECFPYLSDLGGFENGDIAQSYIGVLATDGSSAGAFYEFKYWILRYLLYTKDKAPAQYRSIIRNKNFIYVFLYIHDHFLELVEEKIPRRVNELILELNNAGINASLEDIRGYGTVFSFYKNSSVQTFVPLHDTAANTVRADMKGEQYSTMLNELRDILAKTRQEPIKDDTR